MIEAQTQARVPHTDARISIAAHLAAATEAARRLARGDELHNPAAYIRTRAERLAAQHSDLWHSLLALDAKTTAENLAYGIVAAYTAPTERPQITTRVVDGTEERFIHGTGWCTVR